MQMLQQQAHCLMLEAELAKQLELPKLVIEPVAVRTLKQLRQHRLVYKLTVEAEVLMGSSPKGSCGMYVSLCERISLLQQRPPTPDFTPAIHASPQVGVVHCRLRRCLHDLGGEGSGMLYVSFRSGLSKQDLQLPLPWQQTMRSINGSSFCQMSTLSSDSTQATGCLFSRARALAL